MLKDKQKPAKTLSQRLAGLNKERGAWGGNLACGVAWQGVVNSATHNTANLAWQVLAGKTSKAKMWQCLLGEADKAKMEQCLGGGLLSLSLSLSLSLLALFGTLLRSI